VPTNIIDLLVEQGTQLGRIEGKLEAVNQRLDGLVTSSELEAVNQRLDGLVTSSEFESRMAAVEATLATNQWWILAAPALVGAVLVVARYLDRRTQKKATKMSPVGVPADRPPALRAVGQRADDLCRERPRRGAPEGASPGTLGPQVRAGTLARELGRRPFWASEGCRALLGRNTGTAGR